MTNEVITKSATDLVCVQLEVHIWSGRRHLDKTDLIHANSEFTKLPEKDLANLGSVKICDPEEIKKFNTFKNKAETVLRRAGLPILGATGIPTAKYPEVFQALTELQTQYNNTAAQFIQNYDKALADWKLKHLLQHPEWEALFRDLPDAIRVGGRLSFAFHSYRIAAPADESESELNGHFEKQMGGLKGELLREVSAEATSFVESLFTSNNGISKARDFVTPKTLGPLRRSASKLDAFRFIDPEIGPLAAYLNDVLSDMPDEGRIDGQKLISLASLGRMMMDHASIKRLCAVAAKGWSPGESLCDNPPVTPAEADPTSEEVGESCPEMGPVGVEFTLAATVPTSQTPTESASPTGVVAEEDETYALCNLL